MKRYGRLMLASLVVVALAGSAAAQNFTNPSSVNLLECWQADGSYGVGVSIKFTPCIDAAGTLGTSVVYTPSAAATETLNLVNYFRYDAGVNYSAGDFGAWYELTYTFDQAVTIGRINTCFSSDNSGRYGARYQWVANGQVIAGYSNATIKDFYYASGGNVNVTPGVTAIRGLYAEPVAGGSVTTQTLTLRVYLDPGRKSVPSDTPRIYGLGVYLADGQQLAINGNANNAHYNLFYEPYTVASLTTTATGTALTALQENRLTDHALGSYNANLQDQFVTTASSWGASIVYEFTALEDGYTASGFMLGMMSNNPFTMTGLKLEFSFDGVDWGDEPAWIAPTDNFDLYRNKYIPLNYDDAFKFVRLSWDSGAGGRLTEFQLFGGAAVVPEPMTMSLLALGGLAVLRRRGR